MDNDNAKILWILKHYWTRNYRRCINYTLCVAWNHKNVQNQIEIRWKDVYCKMIISPKHSCSSNKQKPLKLSCWNTIWYGWNLESEMRCYWLSGDVLHMYFTFKVFILWLDRVKGWNNDDVHELMHHKQAKKLGTRFILDF